MNNLFISFILILVVFSSNIFSYETLNQRWNSGFNIWNSSINGNVNVSGMNVDLDFDTNISDDSSPGFFVNYRTGANSHFTFKYNFLSYESIIKKAVTFNSIAYNTGSEMKLRIHLIDLTLFRDIYDGESTDFDISFGLKGAFSSIDLYGLSGATAGISEEDKFTVPFPEFGTHINLKITDNFYWNNDLSFMYLAYGDNKTFRSVDLDTGLHYLINAPRPGESKRYEDWFSGADWFFEGGFKSLYINGQFGDNDADEVRLRFKGIYLGLHAKF